MSCRQTFAAKSAHVLCILLGWGLIGTGTVLAAEGVDSVRFSEVTSSSASCTYETASGMRTFDYLEWFVELASFRANYKDADSDFTRAMMQGPAKTLVNECSTFYEKLQDRKKPWSKNSAAALLKMALDQSDGIKPDSIFREVRRWARELRE